MFGLFETLPPSPFLVSVLGDLAKGKYSYCNSYIKRSWRGEFRERYSWHIWSDGNLWRNEENVPITRAERSLIKKAFKQIKKIEDLSRKDKAIKLRY